MATEGSNSMLILIVLGVVGLFGIITFSLSAATLGTLNKHYSNLDQQLSDLRGQVYNITNSLKTTPSPTTTTTPIPTPSTPAVTTDTSVTEDTIGPSTASSG